MVIINASGTRMPIELPHFANVVVFFNIYTIVYTRRGECKGVGKKLTIHVKERLAAVQTVDVVCELKNADRDLSRSALFEIFGQTHVTLQKEPVLI
jgi:hypothetical protein